MYMVLSSYEASAILAPRSVYVEPNSTVSANDVGVCLVLHIVMIFVEVIVDNLVGYVTIPLLICYLKVMQTVTSHLILQ